MNREYLIMRIALGDTTAEANDITLTDEDKGAIEWYKKESEKAKKEGGAYCFLCSRYGLNYFVGMFLSL